MLMSIVLYLILEINYRFLNILSAIYIYFCPVLLSILTNLEFEVLFRELYGYLTFLFIYLVH
jgi:hypothetical protein